MKNKSPQPSHALRTWTTVFGRTSTAQVFSMKGTRRLCCHLWCLGKLNPIWAQTVRIMDELKIGMERKDGSSPGNASEYEYVYQFLGGRFITVGGSYWGGKHGAYVEGIRPLRFLCYRLGLTQPRRLLSENRVPTLQELKDELAGKVGVRQVE